MCMGFAKDIKAWVCLTEQNQRDGMLQAWAEGMAGVDSPALTLSGTMPVNAADADSKTSPHAANNAGCASTS